MTLDQLEAIEDRFGRVALLAVQAAARCAACGLFADFFMIAEARGRSLAAQ
jgi:hypothetical protein